MVKLKRKLSVFKIILLTVIFAVSFAGGRFIAGLGVPDRSPSLQTGSSSEELPGERLNVLLLGVDARPGEKDARTDSMILVSIDRATKKIAMVSIPRDTLVELPGHGKEKINAANVIGGVDMARETVEGLMGVEIPYYVKTNFDGFKDIVDTLGGVTIDVEKRMAYRAENINLYPGTQRLNGYNALAYVRYRHDALGDIARTGRQQKFLTALAREMLQPASLLKLPKLAPQVMGAVETNLSLKDMYFLTKVASNLDAQNIASATLPGIFYNARGASYWQVDKDQAKLVLNDLFSGAKVATIEGSYDEPKVRMVAKPPVRKKAAVDVAEAKEPVKEVLKDASSPGSQEPGTSTVDGQPPAGSEPPVDGQPPANSQYPPGNGSQPGNQTGSGTAPGTQPGSGQPVPPTVQPPVNPPAGQSGNPTVPQQPVTPQPPAATTGAVTGGTAVIIQNS